MLSRRELFRWLGASTAGALLGPAAGIGPLEAAEELDTEFAFTPREREVLRAAANRIVPPFRNDAIQFHGAGDPQGGNAVGYIERLLAAFNTELDERGDPLPPRIYPSVREPDDPPGHAFTDRQSSPECAGGHLEVPGGWLELPPDKEIGWRRAIAFFQSLYRRGLAQLDRDALSQFGSGFPELPGVLQTALLETYDGANLLSRVGQVYSAGGGEPALVGNTPDASAAPRSFDPVTLRFTFFNTLFTHTIEATYGDPVYGGNTGRIGWKLAGFGGPRHPEGYFPEELETRGSCEFGVPVNFDLEDPLG
jgi:hypothetical protein